MSLPMKSIDPAPGRSRGRGDRAGPSGPAALDVPTASERPAGSGHGDRGAVGRLTFLAGSRTAPETPRRDAPASEAPSGVAPSLESLFRYPDRPAADASGLDQERPDPAGREWTPASPAGLSRGRVTALTEEGFLVLPARGDAVSARRAAGCLLRPEPGDLVLFDAARGAPAYVLCVLERLGPDGVLDGPGNLRLGCPGRLELRAGEVSAAAAGAMSLAAGELSVEAKSGRFGFGHLSVLAAEAGVRLRRGLFSAEVLDSLVTNLTQKARTCVRVVEEDILRAGGVRQYVRGCFFLRSGRAVVRAEEDVSIDGERIDIG